MRWMALALCSVCPIMAGCTARPCDDAVRIASGVGDNGGRYRFSIAPRPDVDAWMCVVRRNDAAGASRDVLRVMVELTPQHAAFYVVHPVAVGARLLRDDELFSPPGIAGVKEQLDLIELVRTGAKTGAMLLEREGTGLCVLPKKPSSQEIMREHVPRSPPEAWKTLGLEAGMDPARCVYLTCLSLDRVAPGERGWCRVVGCGDRIAVVLDEDMDGTPDGGCVLGADRRERRIRLLDPG